jgi:hypothetical protein
MLHFWHLLVKPAGPTHRIVTTTPGDQPEASFPFPGLSLSGFGSNLPLFLFSLLDILNFCTTSLKRTQSLFRNRSYLGGMKRSLPR